MYKFHPNNMRVQDKEFVCDISFIEMDPQPSHVTKSQLQNKGKGCQNHNRNRRHLVMVNCSTFLQDFDSLTMPFY